VTPKLYDRKCYFFKAKMAAITLAIPYETDFTLSDQRMPTTKMCPEKPVLPPEEQGLSCPVRVEVSEKADHHGPDIVWTATPACARFYNDGGELWPQRGDPG